MPRIRKIYQSGFTLIELMLASALLLSALGAFLVTFNTILKNANYSQGLSLAFSECRTQLEKMVAHNFGSLLADYSAGGDPGPNFNLTTSPIIGITGRGNITITERSDLVPGGWQQAVAQGVTWSPRQGATSLVYNNKMWVISGYDDTASTYYRDIWWTDDLNFSDGQTWHCATPDAGWGRHGHTSIVYGNKMWVMGGIVPFVVEDICYSVDGIEWLPALANPHWSPRWGHTSVVYDNKMWVMGGCESGGIRKNDVWWTDDGINWHCATANANWLPRYSHTSLVYDNKMWVMGGVTDGGGQNDVWWTDDGQTWNQVTTPNPHWSRRYDHASIVYDNKMWVMGGFNVTAWQRVNDVWWTDDRDLADGQTWHCATPNAEWSRRQEHASLVYKNRMWVMGGVGSGPTEYNDVWYCMGSGGRLFEVVITVSWRHPDSRIFGEDTNFNGILDVGEDIDGDGNLSSPAQLRVILSDKNIAATRRLFLGRP